MDNSQRCDGDGDYGNGRSSRDDGGVGHGVGTCMSHVGSGAWCLLLVLIGFITIVEDATV